VPQDLLLEQPSLPGFCQVADAVKGLSHDSGDDERGAIFTRREVVEFILDLVGYSTTRALPELTILEPSFGGGDFLLPLLDRLLAVRKTWMTEGRTVGSLATCIRGVELHQTTFDRTRTKVIERLVDEGFEPREATQLADQWLVQGDFLLTRFGGFDFVVGNPPYVRQELIPAALLHEYRKRFATLFDRADLYIPFFEHSLRLLRAGGQLSFICADRWMKNRYGGPLRALVSHGFHLRAYVDMVDTPAFQSDVIAYPAITLIAKDAPGPTRVAERPTIDTAALGALAAALVGTAPSPLVRELRDVAKGDEPWILHASNRTDLIRRIEAAFPLLEDTGCKVGIGVATGADAAYIGRFDELDVEPDRKLPLATTRDIVTGHVQWRGYGVINPFTDEGPLVDLAQYPKLRRHLEARRAEISGRHVAQKTPANWYRTIDRITPSLAQRPKLLIPDIKGEAQVVFEEGKLYPHHNLYFVVSTDWELRALQAVLLSKLTRLFIATYSTKMRGGFLRFQAQYLRRIRLPLWASVPEHLRRQLTHAALALDLSACDEAVADLYSLTHPERDLLASV
jgi:TaqI-like C-terminal specificity domain/Eco57I restriction-modification methylase